MSVGNLLGSEFSVEVVLIGLNEEKFLKACIESVRHAWARYADTPIRITYVDSASSDRSAEIARRAGVRVLEIESEPSAAAARQIGLGEATSQWILFLDADMRLDPGWFTYCGVRTDLLQSDAIGGIIGRRNDHLIGPDGSIERVVRNVYRVNRERRAPHIGGALFGRRAALEAVGGYRTDLVDGEEPELLARLLKAGCPVREVAVDFIDHYWDDRPGAVAKLRRWFAPGRGPRETFGRAWLHATRGRYLGAFTRVYRWTTLVWLVDVATLALLFGEWWVGGVVLQLVSVTLLSFRRRPAEWLLARARLVGLLEAWIARIAGRGGPPPVLRYTRR